MRELAFLNRGVHVELVDERNDKQAYYWMLLARAQEPEIAEHFLKELRKRMPQEQRAEAEAAAKAFNPS